MRLNYVKQHPNTMTAFAVATITGAFISELTRSLSEAELELSVLKHRAEENADRFGDYCDVEGCMQRALNKAFPEEGPTPDDEVNMSDPFVIELSRKAWTSAAEVIDLIHREASK